MAIKTDYARIPGCRPPQPPLVPTDRVKLRRRLATDERERIPSPTKEERRPTISPCPPDGTGSRGIRPKFPELRNPPEAKPRRFSGDRRSGRPNRRPSRCRRPSRRIPSRTDNNRDSRSTDSNRRRTPVARTGPPRGQARRRPSRCRSSRASGYRASSTTTAHRAGITPAVGPVRVARRSGLRADVARSRDGDAGGPSAPCPSAADAAIASAAVAANLTSLLPIRTSPYARVPARRTWTDSRVRLPFRNSHAVRASRKAQGIISWRLVPTYPGFLRRIAIEAPSVIA